jgi:hypothetical protein
MRLVVLESSTKIHKPNHVLVLVGIHASAPLFHSSSKVGANAGVRGGGSARGGARARRERGERAAWGGGAGARRYRPLPPSYRPRWGDRGVRAGREAGRRAGRGGREGRAEMARSDWSLG